MLAGTQLGGCETAISQLAVSEGSGGYYSEDEEGDAGNLPAMGLVGE